METFYTARLHGFPNLSRSSAMEPALNEESLLSLLIVLGSSVSLVGLVFAFITYSLFSDLRNLSGTTLMNLLAALFMTQLLYVIGVGGVYDPELCVALAFSLQYVRLCSLCWILSMTHHMYSQFRTNLNLVPTNDKSIGKHFLKYSIFAWGVPTIVLAASIFIQYKDKAGKLLNTESLKLHNCWFLDKNAFVYGLLIPASIIEIITLSYLIRAAIVGRYVISMQVNNKVRDKMKKKWALQLILFTKITIFLGLVIALGGLTKILEFNPVWVGYNTAQSLQGIFVAMLVTCNCHVLKIYTKTFKSKRGKYITTNYGNIADEARKILGKGPTISKSTSLQLLTWDPTPDAV